MERERAALASHMMTIKHLQHAANVADHMVAPSSLANPESKGVSGFEFAISGWLVSPPLRIVKKNLKSCDLVQYSLLTASFLEKKHQESRQRVAGHDMADEEVHDNMIPIFMVLKT
jgi:hypothetical protein